MDRFLLLGSGQVQEFLHWDSFAAAIPEARKGELPNPSGIPSLLPPVAVAPPTPIAMRMDGHLMD